MNGFKRILASKSFKKSSSNLCDALATMTKRLCTEYVVPVSIEAITVNRLIPLDKGEGAVRPIGIGEVIRRIIGKCVINVTKWEVMDASGSLQVCAGQKSGREILKQMRRMRRCSSMRQTPLILLTELQPFTMLE